MNRRQRRYGVSDKKAFSEIIRGIVRRFGGQMAAERATGIDQSNLARWRNHPPDELPEKSYRAVFEAGTLSERSKLHGALMGPSARGIWWAYDQWMKDWEPRLSRGHSVPWAMSETGITRIDATKDPSPLPWRLAERRQLLKHLEARRPWVLIRFRGFLKKFGHLGARSKMAIARAVDPLLDGPESGFVERSWRELSDDDLAKFVDAGLTREKILLNRSPDLMRIQETGALSLNDFRKRFGSRHIVKE